MSHTSDITSYPFSFKDSANQQQSVAERAGDAFRDEANQSWMEKALNTAGDGVEKVGKSVLKQGKLLGEGIVTGAVLNPINAVTQTIDAVSDCNLPKLEFSNQAEVNNSTAGKIGTLAGVAAECVATAGAVSAVSGLEAGSLLAMGTTGAIQGGVFTPVDNATSTKDLIEKKVENAVLGCASGVVMGGVAGKIEGAQADNALTTLADQVKVKAFAGAAGGVASGTARAEGKALMERGEFASSHELAYQVVASGTAGAVGKVEGTVNPGLGDSVAGKIASGTVASVTGDSAGKAAKDGVLQEENKERRVPRDS